MRSLMKKGAFFIKMTTKIYKIDKLTAKFKGLMLVQIFNFLLLTTKSLKI